MENAYQGSLYRHCSFCHQWKNTFYWWYIPIWNGGTVTTEAKAKLQDFWKNYQYLIIDEYSMQAKDFFALLLQNISIAKEGSPESAHEKLFGGINVIICGNHHQFPPDAQAIRNALFYPSDEFHDSHESQVGQVIYEEFETVVVLKEQIQVTDKVWHDFLQHLHHSQVKECHLKMLRKLVIRRSQEPQVNFSADPWKCMSLITPHHAICKQWNEAAVQKCVKKLDSNCLCVWHRIPFKGDHSPFMRNIVLNPTT